MWRWEITEDAAYDLEGIWDYVFSYSGSEAQASSVVDGLERLFDRICEHPFLYATYEFPKGYQPRHEYRSVNEGSYKVFYRTDAKREAVLIWRVRHVASDFTRARL